MPTERQQQERETKAAYWRPHLDAWQQSQQTAKHYCQQQQLSLHQFKYWQKVLYPQTKKPRKLKKIFPKFIDVNLPAQPNSVTDNALLEVNTPYGFTLRLNKGLSIGELSTVFSVLKQLSC